ncbi:GDSL esterase/lipase At1g71250 [Selaginella moellendorffii]|nr:GDSL esterase/lipase At1g71250 [Selaginella moellendorffii]|eukprot:XP_002963881.2 GDSL esterase/lipase At1g71250 [Selaginella moellendorffii]
MALVLALLFVVATIMLCCCPAQQSQPLVPAAFIFGDSLVDVGNNNHLAAVARGDTAPNGIDFPLGATGRFSNGRTVVDVVGELIGLPLVPPYLDPSAKGSKILQGVSYASGAAGIEDETGGNYAERITFWKQIQWFGNSIGEISSMLGPSAASSLISRSLVAIIMGSNDYINNYFLPYTRSHNLPTSTFRDTLLSIFSKQLQEIYRLGARKIVVANVGPLGCIPSSLFLYNSTTGGCIEPVEAIVRDFNDALKPMLVELNSQLPGATIVYGNVYNIFRDVIDHPSKFGFDYGNRGCCGAGPFNGQVPCLPGGLVKYCPDRTKYVFWDPYHPTDAANVVLGKRLFDGGLDDASPINVRQLCLL